VATTIVAMSTSISGRLGTRATARTSGSVTTTTVIAYPVTSSPTWEGGTRRSSAISVSRPTGMVSAVT
jgi:hypothetical protein